MNKTCRVLIIEDEYFLANDLKTALRAEGAEIVGSISDLSDALAHVEQDGFDAAVIDIKLKDGQSAYPLADTLIERGIPFVFATGYSKEALPDRFWEVQRFEKPYDTAGLAKQVVRLYEQRLASRGVR